MNCCYIFPIFVDEYDKLVEVLAEQYGELPNWKYRRKKAIVVDYNGRGMIDGYVKITKGNAVTVQLLLGIPKFVKGAMFPAKSWIGVL